MKKLRITVEGKSYDVEIELLDEGFAAPSRKPVASSGSTRVSAPAVAAAPAPAPAPAKAAGAAGDVVSPLAAVVVSVDVAVGDVVEKEQKLFTLEAMKMNTIVPATEAGTVKAIHVSAGDSVEEGQSLVTIG